MFRSFIIALEILALIGILRAPFVQYWFTDMQIMAADWIATVVELPDQHQLSNLREDVFPYLVNLNEDQVDYLQEVLSSKGRIETFHGSYCQAGDKNPYIYGSSLSYVCSEINRSNILRT